MNEKSDNELINELILDGAIEVAGIEADTGNFLYAFTPKIREVMPSLFKEHSENVNSWVMRLWEKGFLDIDLFSDDPIITITKKALNKEELLTMAHCKVSKIVKKGEPIDRALKRLKGKIDAEGLMDEVRRLSAFETPVQRTRRKAKNNAKRAKMKIRFNFNPPS